MKKWLVTDGAGEMPDPGVYRAEICGIEEKMGTFEGKETPQWQFTWKLLAYDDGEPITDGREARQWANQTLGPKSKLIGIISAVLGRQPEPGEEIDPEDLMGRPAMITMVEYTKQNGSPGVKVASVAPVGKRRRATPTEQGELVAAGVPAAAAKTNALDL